MKAKCPSCESWVYLEDDAHLGDQVECPDCEEPLKVIRRNPPKLDFCFGDYGGEDDEDEEQNGDEEENW